VNVTLDGKKALIAGGIVVAALGVAYGIGRYQGHTRVAAVESELETTRSGLESQLEKTKRDLTGEIEATESKLEAATTRAQRLDARRRIHLSLMEMRALNFGHARTHLQKAGKQLATAASGDEALTAVAQEIEATRIEPTDNLDAQIQRLQRLAKRVDELVPPE
jgi:hypothetical protein